MNPQPIDVFGTSKESIWDLPINFYYGPNKVKSIKKKIMSLKQYLKDIKEDYLDELENDCFQCLYQVGLEYKRPCGHHLWYPQEITRIKESLKKAEMQSSFLSS